LKQKHQELELLQKKAEAESKRLQGQGIGSEKRNCQRVSGKCRCTKQSWYQLSICLIVVTQHYDTLQAIGAETNSNLILLPNSPQAGSEMLNNMVASFTASNMVGNQ
jgi:hypothetical protein